jgi:hypothetical protein
MTYGFKQPHDGYTLTGLSESNVTAGVQGGWDKNFDVWDPFIVGGSPDSFPLRPAPLQDPQGPDRGRQERSGQQSRPVPVLPVRFIT